MAAPRRVPSLKRVVGFGATIIGIVALVTCGVLAYMSWALHRSGKLLSESTESVVLAADAEHDLFLIERVQEPIVRLSLENGIRRQLDLAQGFVSTPAEQELLDKARLEVDAYLAQRGSPEAEALFQRAQRSLGGLSSMNVVQARNALAGVRSSSQIASLVGFSVLGLLVATILGVGLWMRRNASIPLFRLAGAMAAFARRGTDVRVQETGAAELRDMSRRFNEMASSIARQDQARLTYLAAVAHDLRNPLTALQISTALLAPGRPLPPEAKLRRLLATIDAQIRRLHRMVGDLLEGARIEAGHLELRTTNTDLGHIARITHDLFAGAAPDHELSLDLPDTEVIACVDAERMEQALNNLVSNAVKYSPHGGVVRIALQEHGDEAILSVGDDGIGIPAADIDRIFEPFQRARGSDEIAPGTGLGLSVVRRIVESHGGHIVVHSVPGAGSTFEIHLPLARAMLRAGAAVDAHSSDSSHALR